MGYNEKIENTNIQSESSNKKPIKEKDAKIRKETKYQMQETIKASSMVNSSIHEIEESSIKRKSRKFWKFC